MQAPRLIPHTAFSLQQTKILSAAELFFIHLQKMNNMHEKFLQVSDWLNVEQELNLQIQNSSSRVQNVLNNMLSIFNLFYSVIKETVIQNF